MKNLTNPFALMLAFSLIALGCQKDEEETSALSGAEAAEIVAQSMSKNAYGVAAQMEDAAMLAQGYEQKKASAPMEDTTFTISSPDSALISYSYTFSYSYALVFDNFTPVLEFNYDMSGSYDGIRLSSASTALAVLEITQLTSGFDAFLLEGSYDRTGTYTMKFRENRQVTNDLNYIFNNVEVDKSTGHFTGGNMEVTLSGTVNGQAYSINGTISFNQDETIVLTIQGESFMISLTDGSVS